MQKSYVAKTTINFLDYEFYIRPGDLLVHDTSNNNRLTVYRNGQIVKVAKQDPIGVSAFLKNRFIEEVVPQGTPVPVVNLEITPEVKAKADRTIKSDKAFREYVKKQKETKKEPEEVKEIEAPVVPDTEN